MPGSSRPTSDPRPMTSDDLWAMVRVGAPVPAPDGAYALVPVTSYDMVANKGRTRLWRVPSDGGAPTPLTAPDVSSDQPAFSPDGRWLAFIRRRDGEKPQLHRMPLTGGEAEKLTDLPLGTGDPKWLPDGSAIVFTSAVIMPALVATVPAVPGAPAAPAAAAATPTGSAIPSGGTAPPEPPTIAATRRLIAQRDAEPVKARVTEDRVFRYWDRWLTGGEVPHLFAIDLATRTITDLVPESIHWFDFMEPNGQYDLAPDGSELAFSADASPPPHQVMNWDIYTVALSRDGAGMLRGGPLTNITADNPGNDLKPRYAPDGGSILYGRDTDLFFYADRVRLARYDRQSMTHEVLTEAWDRSVAAWDWARDGQSIWITAEHEGRQALFTMPPAVTTMPELIVPGGTASGLAAAADGAAWFGYQDLSRPPEVHRLKPGTAMKKLTGFNDERLAGLAFGSVEDRTFAGADGARVQMYLIHPPGFDPKTKYPLVHAIHGGPHGIFGDQFHWRWNAHLFAAAGYVVAMVNFHGSTSWGQDFAASIVGDHPTKPFADIMAATDELVKTGYIDPARMACIGGSYGGYMVAWIAGHTDRFRCYVNHAGVYDIHAQYASDVSQGRARAYGGEPWDGLETIDRFSPARFAKGFNDPMLVIHGDNDYRVPATQGLEAFGVLKAKGVPARLVSYPDENHWILSPRNSRHWYGEVQAWLARWLGA